MANKVESPESDGPLRKGQTIQGGWTIEKEIGEGGFGTVYKAINSENGSQAAVKVCKKNSADVSFSEILWELGVYKQFQSSPHCPKLIAYNVDEYPHFLIIQLLGPSLSSLRRRMMSRLLPKGSVAAIIKQCLVAVKHLHNSCFIHRDIKPSNFAIGLGSKIRTIYLIDFGMCRRYCRNDKQLLNERPRVGFRGTVRYASSRAHMEKDLSRSDDLVSLFYMAYEMLVGELPWKWEIDSSAVLNSKLTFTPKHMAVDQCIYMKRFAEHIESLSYNSEPEYPMLEAMLSRMMEEFGFEADTPYGWEGVLSNNIDANGNHSEGKSD